MGVPDAGDGVYLEVNFQPRMTRISFSDLYVDGEIVHAFGGFHHGLGDCRVRVHRHT